MEMSNVCPKCRFGNVSGLLECPKCGVVISKYKNSTVSQVCSDSELICACGIYSGKETTVCHGCGLAKENTIRDEKGHANKIQRVIELLAIS